MDRSRRQEEIKRMERIRKIYEHPLYQEYLVKNRAAEESRIFCGHDLQHFLDVARLAYIFSLERAYGLSKEDIYAAALLHDIGKWQQYAKQVPHEKASAQAAGIILTDTGFEKDEMNRILCAILNHREEKPSALSGENNSAERMLSEVLYDADKISRCCFMCKAEDKCNWCKDKKNLMISW